LTLPFEGWRAGISVDGKPAAEKGLPDGLAAILRSLKPNARTTKKKSLGSGLRKHFDDKVRPSLAGKLPAIAKLDGLKKQLADYQRDKLPRVMVMSDAKPRQTAIPLARVLKPAEKSRFQPEVSAAAP